MYDDLKQRIREKTVLTYYLIAAHPGCEEKHMHELKQFTTHEPKMNPEQAQVFTPTLELIQLLCIIQKWIHLQRKKFLLKKKTKEEKRNKKIVVAKNAFGKFK